MRVAQSVEDSESRPSQVAVPGARFSLSHLKARASKFDLEEQTSEQYPLREVLAHLGPRQSTSLLTMKIDTGRRTSAARSWDEVGYGPSSRPKHPRAYAKLTNKDIKSEPRHRTWATRWCATGSTLRGPHIPRTRWLILWVEA